MKPKAKKNQAVFPGRYHISEVAEQVGVHPRTIKRWIKEGKVEEVDRDRRGWRLFTEEDIKRIREYAFRIEERPSKRQSPDSAQGGEG